MSHRLLKWVPLTGVAFVALVIIGFVVIGSAPDASDPPDEIVQYYTDEKTRIYAGTVLLVAGTVLFIWFASYLKGVLERGDGDSGILSRAAFVGPVVFAVGGAFDSTLMIAMSEAVDAVEPAQIQTLQALWDNDFVPMVLGISLFMLSAGLSIVLHRTLPVWLGWLALLIGVLALTPVGWFSFMGTGVWILIVSVILLMREGKAPAAPVVE